MTARAPALPNFLIIGAEKAATTWLARGLAEHPEIFVPPEKELFYFSSRFDRGLEWYAGQFRDWSGERRVGEATPVYLSHPDAPHRIRETLDAIDLFVSLRHPVDRGYSAYWHNLRHGRIPPERGFADCLEADAWEIRTRGMYAVHLGRYLDVFPRERLVALVYDRIQADPARALRGCLERLGVDASFRPTTLGTRLNEGGADITTATGPVRRVRSILRSSVLWARHRGLVPVAIERRLMARADRVARRAAALGSTARSYEPLAPDERARLFDRFYRSDVDRLEELLGLDLSMWRLPDARPTGRAAGRDVVVAGGSRPS